MRLIDADKLYLHLNDIAFGVAPLEWEQEAVKREKQAMYDTILSIMDIIDKRQTAFDKDMVIEQIGNAALNYQVYEKIKNDFQDGFESGCYYGFVKAQEIVERGGVDDTV